MVIIYGAGGFVGKHLVSALKGVVESITLVDASPIDTDIVRSFRPHFREFQHIVSDSFEDIQLLAPECSVLICLAGATSVDAALEEPKVAITKNINIATGMCEFLRNSDTCIHAIYMSSDEVLGPSRLPLEPDAPLKPSQPYAASKAAAEIIVHNYRDVYSLDILTLRSCNLVGPFQKRPKLIPSVTNAFLANHHAEVHGDGEQMREWMAVQDLCDGIIKLMNKSTPPDIYHAASGVHLSVNSVIKLISDELGVQMNTIHIKDRLVQDYCYAMDSTCLRDLAWTPRTDVVLAIKEAARWYFNNPYWC